MQIGMFSDDPIIVMGMHRSGTTLLAQLLREMGGHLGADLSGANCESLSFQRLNIHSLFDCNASWHSPGPMWEAVKDHRRIELMATRLRSEITGKFAGAFWGARNSGQSSTEHPFWGWKDPRNTLTLPIWLHLFPHAKTIYIVRNGVDVARSLVKRDRPPVRARIERALKKTLLAALPWLGPRTQGRRLEKKPRPFTLEEAFRLWTDYLSFADFHSSGLPAARILRLRYEDLLCEPLASLQRIADFVAAETSDRVLEEIAGRVNSRRRFAFLTDAELCEFYRHHCEYPQMVNYGYDRILDESPPPKNG